MAKDPTSELRELERRRWKEREEKDLEVERSRGPRPLEGYAGGHTTWTGLQDDGAAAGEHAEDAQRSLEASEAQARRAGPAEEEEPWEEDPQRTAGAPLRTRAERGSAPGSAGSGAPRRGRTSR